MVKLFTPEYKKQCVDMVLEGKQIVTQVFKMMCVNQSALNRWRRQFLAEQDLGELSRRPHHSPNATPPVQPD